MKIFPINSKKITSTILLVTLFFITGCKKDPVKVEGDDDDDNGTEHVVPKGFGYSDEYPEGQQFVLPQGLVLAYQPAGYDMFNQDKCDNVTPEQIKSDGRDVPVCIGLRNITDNPIIVEFPPGFIMVCDGLRTQNGILQEKATIVVPAKTTYYSALGLHCINGGARTAGGSYLFTYKIGPVTNYKPLLDFFKELGEKKNTRPNGQFDAFIGAAVGTCISNIYNHGKMDDVTRKNIYDAMIPNK